MENINIKPTTFVISLIVFIIIVTYVIYKYIDNKMKVKMHRQKKKLKKYYETQFNKMFYNNTPTTNENKQPQQNIQFEDNQEPDGYDSSSSSLIESDHADPTENQKILDDDYKNRDDNGKRPRGISNIGS
jgi:type II secretory pathway pseudopilin PulG